MEDIGRKLIFHKKYVKPFSLVGGGFPLGKANLPGMLPALN